jgi:hypothetical protein
VWALRALLGFDSFIGYSDPFGSICGRFLIEACGTYVTCIICMVFSLARAKGRTAHLMKSMKVYVDIRVKGSLHSNLSSPAL